MSLDIKGDLSNIDWGKALGDALQQRGVDNADGAASLVLDGDNLVISYRDPVSGKEVAGRLKLPESGTETFAKDVADFLDEFADWCDKLAANLKILANELDEPTAVDNGDSGTTDGEVTRTSAQNTIFSIYELINMLQQIAQKQRNNARAIRYQELESQKGSIEAQAEYQRKAAMWGMVISTVTAACQVGMAVYSTGSAVKGVKKMDTCAAGQDINQAKNDLKTLENADNSPAANKRVSELEGNCTDGQKASVKEALEERDCGAAKTKYEKAKAEFESKGQNCKALENDLASTKGTEPDNSVKIKDLETKVEAAKTEVETAKGQLETAKAEYTSALDEEMAKMDTKYEEASAETKKAEGTYVSKYSRLNNEGRGSEMEAAQTHQEDIGAQRSLMKAKVTAAKAEMGTGNKSSDMKSAKTKLETRTVDARTDKGFKLAETSAMSANAQQMLVQTIGSFGQGIANHVQTSIESHGTEEQARQKELEQFRDETNQLFQQSQDVVNNTLNLYRAVIQAESDTMEMIIKA